MKAAESLFEFMPYGAPELLQSRRERLASALLLSSLATLALFLSAGGLARLIVVPPVVIPQPCIPPHDIQLPPTWTTPRPLAPEPGAQIPKPTGIPIPVPEPALPVDESPGAADRDPAASGRSGGGGEAESAQPRHEVLPEPDEYVRVDQLPEPVKQVKPDYPEIAQQAGVEGLVIVKVLVGKTGHVHDVRLDDKRQVPMLNEAALAAARQWVFTPALTGGNPVAVWAAIPFHFRLHD